MNLRIAALMLVVASSAVAARAAEKMNVLYVASDDLCNRLGTYGDPMSKSPNIDRLAAKGVRFDKAYCQFPLCNPSRSSFLTGLRPDHTTVYDNARHFREHDPNIQTLPQTFQKGGYYVARAGKLYHYGVPTQIGTDGHDDPPSWMKTVNPKGRDKTDESKVVTLTPGQYGGTLSWLSADGTDEEQTDGLIAAATIDLLEANKDNPFFVACGFFRPHTPYVAPHKWFELYPLEKCAPVELPSNYREGLPAGAFGSHKKEQEAMTDRQKREAIQAYYAATSFMDAQLGKLLDALDRLKLADKTIIVFHSDHGYHLSEHGLWQKMSIWENSARVPLIVYDPRAKGNGKPCSRTVELVDLHATLADLCGLQAPKTDGESLRPLLDDPTAAWSHPAFTQVTRGRAISQVTPGSPAPPKKSQAQTQGRGYQGRSVRTERYRYIEWDFGREGAQLYDYQNDPQEEKNLANDPAHVATVKELSALLKKNYP
jgi:iduronate 2-sulfatase